MRTTPLTYQDFLMSNPEGELPLKTAFYTDNKQRAACSCRPDFMQRAIAIVDCRHLDKNIVPQDWACSGCWSKWIRASGAKDNLFEIAKASPVNAALKAEVAKANKFKDHPNTSDLQTLLVNAKEKGELRMVAPKRECFTRSWWFKAHDIVDADRWENTKFNFLP